MRSALGIALLHCATTLACAGSAARGAATARPDDGFASVIRVLVTDSAMGGAGRAERPATAADSITTRLLEQAGYRAAPRVEGQALLCPASTLANGAPPPGLRGYYLRLEVVPGMRDPMNSTT